MIELIKANVLWPATTRLGSLAGGGLIMLGATEAQSQAVELGVAAMLAFGVDLMLAWFRKRNIIRQHTERGS